MLTPQMMGDPWFPGEFTENVSVRQSPMEVPVRMKILMKIKRF